MDAKNRITQIETELRTLNDKLQQTQQQAQQLTNIQQDLLQQILKKQGALDELQSHTK